MHLRPISAEMLCLEQYATSKELGKGCRCKACFVACRGPSVQSMISAVDYTHIGSCSEGRHKHLAQGCITIRYKSLCKAV